MIWKGIFFLSWLGILVLSGFAIYESIFPQYILQDTEMTNKIIIVSISAFYIVVTFAKFLFLFAKEEKNVIVDSETGKLGVSLSAIENLVKGIINSKPYATNVNVKSKVKNNAVVVKAEISAKAIKNLNLEIKNLQNLIIRETEIKTGIQLENVELIIKKLNYNAEFESQNTDEGNINRNTIYSSEVDRDE